MGLGQGQRKTSTPSHCRCKICIIMHISERMLSVVRSSLLTMATHSMIHIYMNRYVGTDSGGCMISPIWAFNTRPHSGHWQIKPTELLVLKSRFASRTLSLSICDRVFFSRSGSNVHQMSILCTCFPVDYFDVKACEGIFSVLGAFLLRTN